MNSVRKEKRERGKHSSSPMILIAGCYVKISRLKRGTGASDDDVVLNQPHGRTPYDNDGASSSFLCKF